MARVTCRSHITILRAGVFLACGAGWAAAHPLCYVDDKATDYDQVLTFCPEAQNGACCTDLEEAEVATLYEAAGLLTGSCAEQYKEVVCGICHSYSAHLYERLGAELGTVDGMTMKTEFCDELVSSCDGQIVFPTYDNGESDYCEKHVGGDTDQFWSYPYTESEIFDSGLTKVFPDLDSESDFPDTPLSMHQSPDGSMYWLAGQNGILKKVDADNMESISTVVDISGGDFYEDYEEGLIDFAFSPMFGTNGYFYLSYTCQLDDGLDARNRLSKFQYNAGSETNTRDSEEVLITTIPKASSIHAGGWVGFKPSDYGSNMNEQEYHDIYWSTGDGGPQTDTLNNGQDTSNLLASIIRVSVPSVGSGYEIPSGNLGGSASPEICANGFRNPFRCGFDRETDELYCGDVGHTNVEEIDIVECGNNYGWSRFEGSRCQEAQEDRDGPCLDADRSGFAFPIFEYCHPDYYSNTEEEEQFTGGFDLCGDRLITGHAVIGGHVYRGQYFSDVLYGAYIFGDNNNRNIYYIKQNNGEWESGTITSDGSVAVVSFTEDVDGELMIITIDSNIYHMPCGDLCATTCLDQAEDQPTFTSLGCVNDDTEDRALTLVKGPTCDVGETAMSAAICASYCATIPGAVYSGVQYAYECFCGSSSDDYDKHGTLSSESCNMLCSANPDEFCGGYKIMEVFELGDLAPTPAPATSTPSPGPGYLGCYADTKSARIMNMESAQDNMTAEVCSELCAGLTYYGTQYGEECWCGDSSTDYDQHGEGTCDYLCGGDLSETCGGYYSMSTYGS